MTSNPRLNVLPPETAFAEHGGSQDLLERVETYVRWLKGTAVDAHA